MSASARRANAAGGRRRRAPPRPGGAPAGRPRHRRFRRCRGVRRRASRGFFFAARVRRARDAHPRDDSLLRGRGVRLAKRRGSRAPGPESARQRARHAPEQTETARFRVRSVGFATLHAVRVSGDFLPARRRARRRHGARGLAPLLEHLLLPRGGDDLPLQLAHLGEAHRGHDVRAGDHRRDERRARRPRAPWRARWGRRTPSTSRRRRRCALCRRPPAREAPASGRQPRRRRGCGRRWSARTPGFGPARSPGRL